VTFATISLSAKSNVIADLKLDFRFDNKIVESMIVSDMVQKFVHEFDDQPAPHTFEIILSGKKPEHTKLDNNSNIIQDVLVEISDLKLSGIGIEQVFYRQSTYLYDINNGKKMILGQFYQHLGCNGVVRFDFYSPAYVWLMENI
jgi:hypothetical protein